MTLLRIYWTIDGIALLIALYFFLDSIPTATPSSGFLVTWFLLLGFLGSTLAGSYWLINHDHRTWALLVAGVPAVLATLLGLWMLLLFIGGSTGGWN
ncbi:osmoprotectant transporter permease [Spirosoma areae]